MNWTRDLPTWSHPGLSRRIDRAPHRWHVQEAGSGPSVLLLPGAGASVHSWRDIIPDLAQTHHVIALDLPGHGFTMSPVGRGSGLRPMADALAGLIAAEDWQPQAIIGHSAGAALALRLTQITTIDRVIGLNPALDTFKGVAGWLFPALARLLALSPFTAAMFTLGADDARARRLVTGTGSSLSDAGYGYYARLMRDRDHVNGALNMMAHWSLDDLIADLPRIDARCLFLIGENDRAVPPQVGIDAARTLPHAEARVLPGLGHLLHEEDPGLAVAQIRAFLSVDAP